MGNSIPPHWVQDGERKYDREELNVQVRIIPAPSLESDSDGFDVQIITNRGDDGADRIRLHSPEETVEEAHELASQYMKRFNENELEAHEEDFSEPRRILYAALETVLEFRD